MMELFLSKVWAFVVSLFLLGLLVQGVQMQAGEERDLALQGTVQELERLFDSLTTSGEGMERTIRLQHLLPAETTLVLGLGYGVLREGDREHHMIIDITELCQEDRNETNQLEELILVQGDTIRVTALAAGLKVVALSPRSYPPGT